jgi:hypothetical protein
VGANIARMRWPDWAGVGERRWKKSPGEEVRPAKTAWDWLQLLIVPAMLAAIAVAFNAAESSRDRSREDRRTREDRALALAARQDATLDSYLKQMSDLMLREHLLDTRGHSVAATVARTLARTITLAAVRRLDGERKGEVIRFLDEARLLEGRNGALVVLDGADLHGADLRNATLVGATGKRLSLRGTDLRGANFDGANLEHADLGFADLRDASFKRTFIVSVSFDQTDLRGAVFDHNDVDEPDFLQSDSDTSFYWSCLTNASFIGAYLEGVRFEAVEGRDVDFSDSHLANASFKDAALTDVRQDGVDRRPRGWGPTGPIIRNIELRYAARHPCADMTWIH